LSITAKLFVEWQRWVKRGNPQTEQMLSALAPKADSFAVDWHFRLAPAEV
jgi:hypothetical protein